MTRAGCGFGLAVGGVPSSTCQGNTFAAVAVAKDIFKERGIGIAQPPPAKGKLLPLDEEAKAQRATQVGNNFGKISPGLVENTTDVLFRDLV